MEYIVGYLAGMATVLVAVRFMIGANGPKEMCMRCGEPKHD